MKTELHRDFGKQWKRLTDKQKLQAKERLRIFRAMPNDPLLYNHRLTGEWRGYRSISTSGDLRAIYEPVGDEVALLVAIGTHSKLYKE
ncbi:MAG: type II toxin-antitoxin system mRNA interferase toxin, RelE/StbE family [Patescibacteria group bacterium]